MPFIDEAAALGKIIMIRDGGFLSRETSIIICKQIRHIYTADPTNEREMREMESPQSRVRVDP
jgi:hypothetical protein